MSFIQIDSARISLAHNSPIMSSLFDLIPIIDENILPPLFSRLCEQLHSSFGLTTRTGACQFVINMCLRCQQLLATSKSICGIFSLIYPDYFCNKFIKGDL